MNPDGTINTVLWKGFAERSLHELADKTKALAKPICVGSRLMS